MRGLLFIWLDALFMREALKKKKKKAKTQDASA